MYRCISFWIFAGSILREYLDNVRSAMSDDSVRVHGYFIWSLIDNVEWQDGYTTKFGLWSLDDSTMARTPKASVAVVREMIAEWNS